MEPFDISGNEVVITPIALGIPQFEAIWARDKSKSKDRAMRELKYIIYLCSYKSPYRSMSDTDKEMYLKKDVIKNPNWEPDEKVKEAIEVYKKLQETTYSRVLKSALRAAEQLREYFDLVDFTKVDTNGKPVYSVKELSSSLKELGGIIKSLTQLEKQVLADQLESASIRGQAEIGDYER